MVPFWQTRVELGTFTAEAQCVIALRMIQFVSNGPRARAAEGRRVVTEKLVAASAANRAAASAFTSGKSLRVIMERALLPAKRQLRKNRRRLLRAS
jgi:hypothetical protein